MDQFLFMFCSCPGPDFNPGPDFIHFSPGPSPSPDFTNVVRVQILSMASPGQSPDFILVRIRILSSFEPGPEFYQAIPGPGPCAWPDLIHFESRSGFIKNVRIQVRVLIVNGCVVRLEN